MIIKTAEEMIADFGDNLTHYEEVVEAMKKYAEQFIELAAEEAKLERLPKYDVRDSDEYQVDKESILELKEQIK